MTRIRHGSEPSGGTRKIRGAHSDSRPAQKGQDGLGGAGASAAPAGPAGLGLAGLWDLRSVGRHERAGEKTTHRPNTASRRASEILEASADAISKPREKAVVMPDEWRGESAALLCLVLAAEHGRLAVSPPAGSRERTHMSLG